MSRNLRVLYCGNYRDSTGWSHAAIAYIQALDAAGVQVACRPIKLNDARGEVSARIRELERNRFDEYDAVIQNLLPHHMDYHGGYRRNIGLYHVETSHFRTTCWADRINCMDAAWVPCVHNADASLASGVTVPTTVVPIPCDTARYGRSYEPLPVRKQLHDHFIFYTIGEMSIRKNFKDLLMAFHLEFDVNEPVSLLIKTTPRGDDQYASWTMRKRMVEYCDGVKRAMKLYDHPSRYKQEIIIADRYSDGEMLRLHASCDCGVFVSHGEAWSLPAFDSMAMGRTPIVAAYGGYLQYMTHETGWLVRAEEEPAYATHLDTFPDLHTSREAWGSVDIGRLRAAMRAAYEDEDCRRLLSEIGQDRAYDFDLAKIGRLMKENIGA